MKYKLPRQVLSSEFRKIISREMHKQKMSVARATSKELKELADVSKCIAKRGSPPYFVCKELGRNLGQGIFLHPDAKPFEKGRVIASYAGVVSFIRKNVPDDGSYAFTPVEDIRLSKQEQLYFDKDSCFRPKRLYSFKVDAIKKGNFTRFINHSEKPNVIAYSLVVPSNRYGLVPTPIEIIYIAKKTILPGEQLLVCYEEGEKCYWGARAGGIKPFPMTPKTFRLTKKGLLFSD